MSMPNALKYILFVLYIIGVTMALVSFFNAQETEKQGTSTTTTNTSGTTNTKINPVQEPSNSNVTTDTAAASAKKTSSTNQTARFVNQVHTGAGTATIESETNQRILQFSSDFHTEAGPDLHVFLSNAASPQTSKELHDGEYVDLGALQNTDGEQTYTIPASVDFDIHSVVIYCVPFKVIFTSANFLPL